MKKNTFLIVSLIWTLLLVIFYPNDFKYSYCGYDDFNCWQKFNLLRIVLLFGPAFLVSSLTTFLFSDDVFQKWKKFTFFSVLAYLLIIIPMPWEVGDEIAGFTKGMAGLVLSILYLVTSLTYIFFLSRKNK